MGSDGEEDHTEKDIMNPAPSETQIQRVILDGLACMGIMAWRNNVSPIPIRRGRAIVGVRRVDPHLRGMADILAVKGGRAIAIEVKTEKGKQSEEQAAWAERFTKAGGMYVLARSWTDIENELKKL